MRSLLLVTLLLLSCVTQAQYLKNATSAMPLKEHNKLLQLAPFANTANKTTAGVFDTTSWAPQIDALWGAGIADTAKLNLFTAYWNHMNVNYPCFVQLPMYNWDSLVSEMQVEIGAGVSRGRLAGIIGNLMTYINDGHSVFYDATVNYGTPVSPGLPVFRGQSGRLGACITATDDSMAMVYEAVPNHPYGLQQGDVILGYNGIPWKSLIQTILRHQLPNSVFKGSTAIATWRRYVKAAGENWYMFDTINIQKCDGSLQNLPVSLMTGSNFHLFCSDQMPVPGVHKLDYDEVYNQDMSYSSGIVTGTNIGYVYMYDCGDLSGDSLYNRVRELVQDMLVDGLIIDIRTNFGGSIMAFERTFNFLNDGNASWVGYGERDDPNNRYSMSNTGPTWWYDVVDNDPFYFSGPVALLTGSEAASAGDLMPVLFKECPNVRSFGKSTAGAYGSYNAIQLGYPGYYTSAQSANFFAADDPGYYLTHTEFPVDEDTWLKKNSVCAGIDNVVTEAIDWINNALDVPNTTAGSFQLDIFPNPASDKINLRIKSKKSGMATVRVTNLTGVVVVQKEMPVSNGDSTEQLNIAGILPPGSYIVSVQLDEAIALRQKLVVR